MQRCIVRAARYRRSDGGKLKGYGWPATLELLEALDAATVSARQVVRMIPCPSCFYVHEEDGFCISRHGDVSPLVFYSPATANPRHDGRDRGSTSILKIPIAAALPEEIRRESAFK